MKPPFYKKKIIENGFATVLDVPKTLASYYNMNSNGWDGIDLLQNFKDKSFLLNRSVSILLYGIKKEHKDIHAIRTSNGRWSLKIASRASRKTWLGSLMGGTY